MLLTTILAARQKQRAMYIKVLSSGSEGNGYIIGDETQQLIIECGVPFACAEKALDYNISNVCGCIVTHEHQDHFGRANEYIMRMPTYATQGTLDTRCLLSHPNANILTYRRKHKIGNFTILPFRTEHDAIEPCGFIIRLPNNDTLLFATDTYYLHYTFQNIKYWMIECNYDNAALINNVKHGFVHPKVASRVKTSHMSLEQCKDTLRANDLTDTNEIILIHLSSQNGAKEKMINEIKRATGKMVVVAEKNKYIELL